MTIEPYATQAARWPKTGRVILAQFDEQSVTVYQAYNPRIGRFAAEHGYFGGDFQTDRMTWIKPNFLWMMYRSGWGTKPDQEVTLAVRLRRDAFDELLASAVPSTFDRTCYTDEAAWRRAVKGSDVRLQWDPDHSPTGGALERRALQLGLRGDALRQYSRAWILGIEDISAFVAEQRGRRGGDLWTPREDIYLIAPQ